MKTIIAGSREITDINDVLQAIAWAKEEGFTISEVISGTARGVDKLGEEYARRNNLPVIRFPANWDKYGKSAGYRRNATMANFAQALIAVWDGKSRGTMHMIDLARAKGLRVFVCLPFSQLS
jgi:hypothetical protein